MFFFHNQCKAWDGFFATLYSRSPKSKSRFEPLYLLSFIELKLIPCRRATSRNFTLVKRSSAVFQRVFPWGYELILDGVLLLQVQKHIVSDQVKLEHTLTQFSWSFLTQETMSTPSKALLTMHILSSVAQTSTKKNNKPKQNIFFKIKIPHRMPEISFH